MVMGELADSTDVAVIGGGPAGYVCALRLAQLGKSVTVIEKEGLGGLCLLHGCIPSKAMIKAASSVSSIADMPSFGASATLTALDWPKMQEWKARIVTQLNGGIKSLCKSAGVQVMYGTAFFESPKRLGISTEMGVSALEFEDCVIATGSLPTGTPQLVPDGKRIVTSREALDFPELPKELAVVGGGYVAVETATAYAKFGTKVTLIVRSTLLSYVDPDAAAVVEKRLKELGVTLLLKTNPVSVSEKQGKLSLLVEGKEGRSEIPCDKVLLAVGHAPVTASLRLEHAGITVNEKGFIPVNNKMQTAASRIYAIGDVCGPPLLAHKAYREAKVAAEVIAGHDVIYDARAVPSVIFSDPEIAYVGLQEHEAKARGMNVVVGKFPHVALGRALISGKPTGFVKMIADPQRHAVLGVCIVGPDASDCISEATLAVESGLMLEDIARTIHPHPTFGEALGEAAEVALGQCVHLPSKK